MDINKDFSIRLVQKIEKYPCLYNSKLPEYTKLECTEEAWIEIAMEFSTTPDAVQEKWRVLRSIFQKRLKQLHLGVLIKPYYLHEHMQFLIPHLHTRWDPENRLKQLLEESERRLEKNNTSEYMNENSINYDGTVEYTGDSKEDNNDSICTDADTTIPPTCSSSERKQRLPTDCKASKYRILKDYRKLKMQQGRSSNTTAVIPHRTENCQEDNDDDPRKLFLLSLLPDVEEMNNAQMRLFKAKTIALINEICI